MVETKTIIWMNNEERMFDEWFHNEKKDWEKYELGKYEALPLGIGRSGLQSLWSQELYRHIFPYMNSFSSVHTYVISDAEKSRRYLIDLEYESIVFRMFITFNQEEFYSNLMYKQKEDDYYWDLDECAELDKEIKSTFKTGIGIVLNVYEELKKFVEREKSIRLLLLTSFMTIEEKDVLKTKKFAEEKL